MNRREFLTASALAAAGVLTGSLGAQNAPRTGAATMKFAQLTDTHMTGFTLQDGLVCPRLPAHAWWATSRRYDLMGYLLPLAIRQVEKQFQPQAIIFGGDQVDDGFGKYGPGDLAQVKQVVADTARTPVRFLYGNHDGPQDKWAQLYGALNWTHDLDGLRLVGLNTGSMEPEKEKASSAAALAHLQEAISTCGDRRLIVLTHQWIYPTDVHGYSMANAPEVLATLKAAPQVIGVVSGHYHTGRYDEQDGLHFCTGKALCEPPFSYSTYEVTAAEFIWTQYKLSSAEKAFVVAEERKLKLRQA